jgi:5-methylcytosine-specific restriction endonuclease McrA
VTEQKKRAREKAYKRQRGQCYYCGQMVAKQKATLDHRVPASDGGNLEDGNAVMACYDCNHAKGSMPESVFRQGEEARREWKRRQADLWRAVNSDPSIATDYAELMGHSATKARAMMAVAEAKRRNRLSA